MTKDEAIATAVTMLSETFRQPLTETAAKAYLLALEDLTEGEVARALKRALRESKFMPSPAELLAYAGKGGAKDLIRRTAEAWEAVRTAMDRYDYTESVDFGPLVNAVVRNMGGWRALCDKSIPDLVWERKKFEELYAAYVEKDAHGDSGRPLLGAFGYAPNRVPIGGVMPPRQIEGKRPVLQMVRELADSKATP